MTWAIYHRGPRAKDWTRLSLTISPGVDACREFYKQCDIGKPGRYILRAEGIDALASAEVQQHEMTIKWHPEWILFALGAKGMHEEVPKVVAYLCEVDAWPKEEA